MPVNKLIYSGINGGFYAPSRFSEFIVHLKDRRDNGVRAQDLHVNIEKGLTETTFHMPEMGVGIVYREFGGRVAQVRLLGMREENVKTIEKIILEEAAKLPT